MWSTWRQTVDADVGRVLWGVFEGVICTSETDATGTHTLEPSDNDVLHFTTAIRKNFTVYTSRSVQICFFFSGNILWIARGSNYAVVQGFGDQENWYFCSNCMRFPTDPVCSVRLNCMFTSPQESTGLVDVYVCCLAGKKYIFHSQDTPENMHQKEASQRCISWSERSFICIQGLVSLWCTAGSLLMQRPLCDTRTRKYFRHNRIHRHQREFVNIIPLLAEIPEKGQATIKPLCKNITKLRSKDWHTERTSYRKKEVSWNWW